MKKKFRIEDTVADYENRIEILLQPSTKDRLRMAFSYYPELRECSHATIAEFIGRSREIVTKSLNGDI